MDSGWTQTWVAIGAAVISVIAAGVSVWQARSAKRQADAAHGEVEPTFHAEIFPDDGRPPWGFCIMARNFNRRPLQILAARVKGSKGLIFYDRYAESRDRLGSMLS